MELSNLLSGPASTHTQNHQFDDTAAPSRTHSYPTRTGMDARSDHRMATPPATYGNGHSNSTTPHNPSMSPFGSPTPKSVAFELLFPESPQYRARLPMRVQIFPHDTTDSIITTVKNFYGLYAGPGGAKGVSFEDEQGNTLIARYENLRNNMVVYVRVIEEPGPQGTYGPSSYHSGSPVLQPAGSYYPGDGHHMPPPQPAQALNYGQPPSRPTSRTSRKRSTSPGQGRGRRSASASTNPPPMKKSRSRSGFKSRGSSAHGSFADNHSDGLNGYSSGDGAPGSVSSRTKSEHLGNTEISLDNIVEGGRRKRAKFESSELPLFAPPQMPAATSNSSVSPARRNEHHRSSFPFTHPSQHPFSNPQPLQSPQSYSNGFGQPGMYTTPAPGRRTRGGAAYPANRQSIGSTPNGNSSGILPTPDPTVGSCMSEEDKDVALQLMRLGEMSNISHGRTSASTLDDTFSGRADAASSTGATSEGESESEDELPPPRRQKREASPILPPGHVKKFRQHLDDILPSQDSTEPSGDEGDYEDGRDETFRPGFKDDAMDLDQGKPKMIKSRSLPSIIMGKPRTSASGAKVRSSKSKIQRPGQIKSKKSISAPSSAKPISPTSLPPPSRKTSNASALAFQHQLGEDEEDLSSKPRCQRCRKSKKGCDRQRPCQRCKDAGLSADQCVSEDEGNGRKGRYGRHMGVPVKKDELSLDTNNLPPMVAAGGQGSPDKSKKRKR
ncbi:related to C6 finger domain protein [Phialocephala subalpina]|uniref:Related to C6 finger domain protein n=1 Tax=Phialocephala subalpina TaxID=576137 RepID=A0A1L7XJB9_9HELO|nr:related to C6 finger domain protein [Phialocephala subalpina]